MPSRVAVAAVHFQQKKNKRFIKPFFYCIFLKNRYIKNNGEILAIGYVMTFSEFIIGGFVITVFMLLAVFLLLAAVVLVAGMPFIAARVFRFWRNGKKINFCRIVWETLF